MKKLPSSWILPSPLTFSSFKKNPMLLPQLILFLQHLNKLNSQESFQKPSTPQDKALPTDSTFHLSWAISNRKQQLKSNCKQGFLQLHLLLCQRAPLSLTTLRSTTTLPSASPQGHLAGEIYRPKPLPGLVRGPGGEDGRGNRWCHRITIQNFCCLDQDQLPGPKAGGCHLDKNSVRGWEMGQQSTGLGWKVGNEFFAFQGKVSCKLTYTFLCLHFFLFWYCLFMFVNSLGRRSLLSLHTWISLKFNTLPLTQVFCKHSYSFWV